MVWYAITDFGDSAALLPVGMVLGLWLIANGRLAAAMLLGGLLAGAIGLVAAGKIAFLGWGIGVSALDFTGISGHSTLAASVIPIGVFLVAERAPRPVRRVAVAVGVAVAITIAISRVAIGVHSWSEVVAGVTLGSLVTALFLRLVQPVSHPALMPSPLVACAVLSLALLVHGKHAPSEYLIRRIALELSGRSELYTRAPLRPGLFGHSWATDEAAMQIRIAAEPRPG